MRPILFGLILLSGADALRAQETCPQGRISHVFIDNHSIFDPASLPPDLRFRWAYETANALHIRTRPSFIRSELLTREGDCYDPEALRESARILREFRFIARADVFAVVQPDGSRHVVVDTRDEWSSKFALNVRYDDGLHFDGVGFVEENFLGRGITIGAQAIDRDEQRDFGMALEIPRIGKTGWDGRLGWARTRIGDSFDQMFVHPFRGEVGTRAFRQRVSAHENLFAYALPRGFHPGTHLVVPVRSERAELSAAFRTGEPGRWLVLGGGITRERVETGSREAVELVREGDFAGREPAPQEFSEPLAGQLSTREATRVNVLVGLRRIRYRSAVGLDALDGVQDVPIGFGARVGVGRSVGKRGPEKPRDTFLSGVVQLGASEASRTLFAHGAVEARVEEPQAARNDGFQDVLAEAHLFAYFQPASMDRHTFLVRVAAHGAWQTTAPFQLAVGGPDGVRGYGEFELPAGRRVVLTFEDRVRVPTPFPDLADLGMTLFADVGAGWAGDTPYAVDSGWRGTVGTGLRIGFPAGSSSVVRIDVAFPLGPDAGSKGAVLRISAREWIGLLDPFQSISFSRSRRSGMAGEYIGVAR